MLLPAALFAIICSFFRYELISSIQSGRKLGLPFVFSTIRMLKSKDLYECGDLQMNDGNRYALCRSIDDYFKTIDLHSTLISVVFLLILLVFLVGKVASQLMNLARTYFFLLDNCYV